MQAIELGGKKQFPFLVDPNTGKQMYESDDVIAYLYATYGGGAEVPLALRLGPLTAITCSIGTLARPMRGNAYRKSRQPAEPLVFWGYEVRPRAARAPCSASNSKAHPHRCAVTVPAACA
jgi:hypothetical protein